MTESKRTILKHQLEDALAALVAHGLGLVIESDTMLLVEVAEVQRVQRKNIGQEVEGCLPGPVQNINQLKKVQLIDDGGALLGAGAA